MKLIKVPKGITKNQAAQLLGLRTYDTAVPQPWIDELTVTIRAIKHELKEEVPEDLYGFILSGTVWCYDRSFMGYPVALTEKLYKLLSLRSLEGNPLLKKFSCLEDIHHVMRYQPATLILEE